MSEMERTGLDPYYIRLFTPPKNPYENESCSKTICRGLGVIGGLAAAVGRNYNLGRPPTAGTPFTFMFCVIGACVGEGLRRANISYRDYDIRRTYHYMLLHPEDFPPPERKKYSEVFLEWDPVR